MNVNFNQNGNTLVVDVEGRLDAATAPELNNMLDEIDESINAVIFDFGPLRYISSAGLRVLINTLQKPQINKVVVRKPSPVILEIIKATGLQKILTIEP